MQRLHLQSNNKKRCCNPLLLPTWHDIVPQQLLQLRLAQVLHVTLHRSPPCSLSSLPKDDFPEAHARTGQTRPSNVLHSSAKHFKMHVAVTCRCLSGSGNMVKGGVSTSRRLSRAEVRRASTLRASMRLVHFDRSLGQASSQGGSMSACKGRIAVVSTVQDTVEIAALYPQRLQQWVGLYGLSCLVQSSQGACQSGSCTHCTMVLG